MQLEERISQGRARVVSGGYWWRQPPIGEATDPPWHFASGLVPDGAGGGQVRGIFHEDFHGSDGSQQLEPKTLSKQKSKKIIRALAGPPLSGEGPDDSGRSLEPVWCWHEFRCSRAPIAIFVVQTLDPGETFRWQSVVLGEKKVMVLFVGPEYRKIGCDWYRWQVERQGLAALLVQDVRETDQDAGIKFQAKGTHGNVEQVWSSLSRNPSFSLFGAPVRWSFEPDEFEAHGAAPGSVFHEGIDDDLDVEAEEAEPEEGTAEAPVLEAAEELTQQQKTLVKRMHDNMGHPDMLTFLRTMRRAKASPAVQKYIKEKFVCEACQSRPLPKPSRPATVVRGYRPGVIVGVDVVFLPDVDPRQLKPVLNIVDWGSGFQALEPMREKTAAEAFRKFWKAWGRHFGAPEVLVTDAGTEFGREFCEMAAGRGIITRQIGSRAPWQQGITERQGGLAKLLFERVRDEVCPTTKEEWAMALRETEAAKNRLYHRSGFTPAQRHLGQNPRIPGCLMGDDFLDAELVEGGANGEMRRVLETRRIAAEAFVKVKSREACARASRARSRTVEEFKAGDIVYVFRRPRERKRKAAAQREMAEGKQSGKPQWVGPGQVLAEEGPNLWVSMRGELWKAAKEQVRKATSMEREAQDLLQGELAELKEELARKDSRDSFKDITGEPFPELDDEEPAESRSDRKRRVTFDDEGERVVVQRAGREQPTAAGEPEGEAAQASGASSGTSSSSSSSTSSSSSSGPPSTAATPRAVEVERRESRQSGTTEPEQEASVTTEGAAEQPEEYRAVGHRVVRPGPYDPRSREIGFVLVDETDGYYENQLTGDYWEYDPELRVLIRWHQHERFGTFKPNGGKGCPVPTSLLGEVSTSFIEYEDGSRLREAGKWRSKRARTRPLRSWRGRTEFVVDALANEEALKAYVVKKRGGDEVKHIPPEEAEAWRDTDGAEWQKISDTGAIRALSVAESQHVLTELKAAGKLDRVLPTRMVRRYKPGELPGEAATRKSRLCIRGDHDPDVFSLERHAPTASSLTLAMAMQVASTRRWRASVGDLRNAFCQSEALHRKEGRLFARQPEGGLKGLEADQLLEIVAGAYGLNDAPAHWRRSLKKALVQLGFEQSALDPTLFLFKKDQCVAGMVIVEVDDLWTAGDSDHYGRIRALRERFTFGKFKYLQDEPAGVGFNGRRMRQDQSFNFSYDLQKFIEERLEPVMIQGKTGDEHATLQEVSQARAVLGSLNWLGREGRPDLVGEVSILSSRVPDLRVKDLRDINKTVERAKATASLCVKVQGIPEENLGFGVVSDASYGNVREGGSQGGHCVVAFNTRIHQGETVDCNILYWKSGRIHRVVNSTLAAESMSLSRALGDLMWCVTLFNELTHRALELKEWESALAHRRLCVVPGKPGEVKNLAVVDAKSLYDHLSKETCGHTADRRTAIEMQIIRQTLSELGASIRWVDHNRMLVDALTKMGGNTEPLIKVITSGKWQIVAEAQEVEHRKVLKAQGALVRHKKSGIKENFGSCELRVRGK